MRIGWSIVVCLWATAPLLAQLSGVPDIPVVGRSDNVDFTNPPAEPVRAMAEWEELQAVAVAWSSQWTDVSRFDLLAAIVQHCKQEVEVIIVCDLPRKIQAQLSERGVTDFSNITFQGVGIYFDRIWIRDFGAHTLYANEVDSMLLVDWMYDADYPVADTASPAAVARYYDLPLYSTTSNRHAFRLDGGNFLSDGLGTAFSSDRVLLENGQLSFVQSVAEDFMGIDNYVVLPRLPYDVVHHVDMHMKLLDEETLLVGQYPEGEGDYAQIEANIDYILENVETPFGKPYQIVRIPMPRDRYGGYPNDANLCSKRGMGCYRTYTNALFVNKTIVVPTYETAYDTTALRIWQELMPGYKIVGINCDELIAEYGAIHCVTKEIGVADPLWIVHEKAQSACPDQRTTIDATIKHRSGVKSAAVFYRTATEAAYAKISMTEVANNRWRADIPAQPDGQKVHYYIGAEANSGKRINRPLPAPEAYWSYDVGQCLTTSIGQTLADVQLQIFPNPTSGNAILQIKSLQKIKGEIIIVDLLGKPVQTLQTPAHFAPRTYSFPIPGDSFPPGIYFVKFVSEKQQITQPIIIRR